MANLIQEKRIRELGGMIEKALAEIYGEKMGFMLNIAPFSPGKSVSDYVSNANRETAILWMLETVERFNNNENIPATLHMEQ